ncbi:adenylate cyclase [Diplonema papillatum]|nr:adenylate cyclase [Diplonema papillatum]
MAGVGDVPRPKEGFVAGLTRESSSGLTATSAATASDNADGPPAGGGSAGGLQRQDSRNTSGAESARLANCRTGSCGTMFLPLRSDSERELSNWATSTVTTRLLFNANGAHTKPTPGHNARRTQTVEALSKIDTAGLFAYVPKLLLNILTQRPSAPITADSVSLRAATLFIDVCGFTKITEELKSSSEGMHIAEHLNKFFALMLDIVEDFDGDVLQFSGDAVLAAWCCNSEERMAGAAMQAVACASRLLEVTEVQVIQFSQREAPVRLGVHVAMGAGDIEFHIVGGLHDNWRHTTLGNGIKDSVVLSDLADMDELVVSSSAKALLDDSIPLAPIPNHPGAHKYLRYPLGACQLPGSSRSPSLGSKPASHRTTSPGVDMGAASSKSPTASHTNAASHNQSQVSLITSHSTVISASPAATKKNTALDYIPTDPAVEEAVKLKVYSFLFDTILHTWGRAGELRTVSSIFVRLMSDSVSISGQMKPALQVIQSELAARDGILNKVLYDDKGVTFLILFGLPGHAHEDDALRAVAFAWAASTKLEGVCQLAMGISRSKVYCGYCGSSVRREYTVLGDGVNVSARVMQHAAGEMTKRMSRWVSSEEEGRSSSSSGGSLGHGHGANAIFADEATKVICASSFRFAGGHDVRLKGKAIGARVWEVTDAGSTHRPFINGSPGPQPVQIMARNRSRSTASPSSSGSRLRKLPKNYSQSRSRHESSADELAELDELDALSGSEEDHQARNIQTGQTSIFGRDPQIAVILEIVTLLQTTTTQTTALNSSANSGSSFTSPNAITSINSAELTGANPSARVISVIGDAAMGKSILLRKVAEDAVARGATVLMTQASPLDKESGYSCIGALLSGFSRKPLGWICADIDASNRDLRPLVNTLFPALSLRDTEVTRGLTDSDRHAAIQDIVVGLFRRSYDTSAVLLCVDDSHWADAESLSIVTHLLRTLPTVGAVVSQRGESGSVSEFVAYRMPKPEKKPKATPTSPTSESTAADEDTDDEQWGGLNAFEKNSGYIPQLVLGPLDQSSTAQLFRKVLGGPADPLVVTTVHAKADGNPGFSEQILVSLLDRAVSPLVVSKEDGIARFAPGVDVTKLDLPDGIEGIITGRVDRLPQQFQHYLKVASIIGPSFSLDLLAKVLKEKDVLPLVDAFALLENNGFVTLIRNDFEQPRGRGPARRNQRGGRLSVVSATSRSSNGHRVVGASITGSSTGVIVNGLCGLSYAFRLHLMSEVLYGMLLPQELKDFHLTIATELEAEAKTGGACDVPALIRHFTCAGSHQRSLHYVGRAADEAVVKGKSHDAVRFLIKALEVDDRLILESNQGVPKDVRRHWLATLCQSQYQVGDMESAYQKGLAVLKECGEVVPEGCSLWFQSKKMQLRQVLGLKPSHHLASDRTRAPAQNPPAADSKQASVAGESLSSPQAPTSGDEADDESAVGDADEKAGGQASPRTISPREERLMRVRSEAAIGANLAALGSAGHPRMARTNSSGGSDELLVQVSHRPIAVSPASRYLAPAAEPKKRRSSGASGGKSQPLNCAAHIASPACQRARDLVLCYHALCLIAYHNHGTDTFQFFALRGYTIAAAMDCACFPDLRSKKGTLYMMHQMTSVGAYTSVADVAAILKTAKQRIPDEKPAIARMSVLMFVNAGLLRQVDHQMRSFRASKGKDETDMATLQMLVIHTAAFKAMLGNPEDSSRRLMSCAKEAHGHMHRRSEAYALILATFCDLVLIGGERLVATAREKIKRVLSCVSDQSNLFTDRQLAALTDAVSGCLYMKEANDVMARQKAASAALILAERERPGGIIPAITCHCILTVILNHRATRNEALSSIPSVSDRQKTVAEVMTVLAKSARATTCGRPLLHLWHGISCNELSQHSGKAAALLEKAAGESSILHMPYFCAKAKQYLSTDLKLAQSIGFGIIADLYLRAGTSHALQNYRKVPEDR